MIDNAGLHDALTLLTWLSPAFPVGAFSYSHGLEWAIEAGDVVDAPSLQTWIADILAHGTGRHDAILVQLAHRAAAAGDADAVTELIGLGLAFQPSRERYLEATAQGTAFLKAVRDSEVISALESLVSGVEAQCDRLGMDPREALPWPYAVAVGTTAGAAALEVQTVTAAYLHAFAAMLVSVGVRAIPLGQTQGLRIVAALRPLVLTITRSVEGCGPDDLGGAVLRADIASMRHETQYTRLFRS